MAGLSLNERLKIRALSAKHSRRRVITRTLSSPFLRWRYGSAATEQILIVPQELRSPDPSFWNELQESHFGLASEVADLRGATPFRIKPPSPAWERELHGFGWLRHLAATEEEEAYDAARELVLDWIATQEHAKGIAYEPAVLARRLISWIAQANMLLEGTDAKTYTQIVSSLSQQVGVLNTTWRIAPDGVPRLTCLIALVLSNLAISGNDRNIKEAQTQLVAELRRQILPDGGHFSRNASVLADLVLDLLPLGQCFQARGLAAPDEFASTVKKSLAFLRFMRMGDGMLARFNGVGTGSPATIATVLAYSDGDHAPVSQAVESGYARIERANTTIVADVGSPPAPEISTEAQAGCLAFEMADGTRMIFVNGGYPGPSDSDWNAVARATASHNTLCLAESSSSRLLRHDALESIAGGLPIRGPDLAMARLTDEHGAAALAASHDGYLGRYGLMHHRRISVSADGRLVEGLDRLEPPKGKLRLKADLPYSVHFHLHPECKATPAKEQGAVMITLRNGQWWRFESEGADLYLEESFFFAESTGPRSALQIVLRGATFGETEIRWRVQKGSA